MPFNSETAAAAGAKGKRGLGDRAKLLCELYNPDKATKVWNKLESMALAGEMDAIKTYLAYLWGKPKESLDVVLPEGVSIYLRKADGKADVLEQQPPVHLLPMNGNGKGS